MIATFYLGRRDAKDVLAIFRPASEIQLVNKRRRIAWFVLLALIAGGIAFGLLRPQEPSYRGRHLSDWLVELQQTQAGKPNAEALEALQQMGTNAIPPLLEMLRARDPLLKLKLIALARKQSLIPVKFEGASAGKWRAVVGFGALKTAGAPAIPALVEMLNDQDTAWPALQCLARLGPPALAPLSRAVTNENLNVRYQAVNLLGSLGGADPPAVVPALLRALKDSNPNVHRTAAYALGNLTKEPDGIVPALVETLADSDAAVRESGLLALGNFGSAAQSAVPALLGALKADQGGTLSEAAHALMKIDPDAALPALLENLDATDPLVRRATIHLLGEMGSKAKAAVPLLTVRSVVDEDEQVRHAATNALRIFNRAGPPRTGLQ